LPGTENADDFSSEYLLPNLIIPGVQKCATTSMYAILRSHPQCRMPAEQELNFFTARWNEWNLPEYSRRCFPDDGRGDLRVFGESSTTYFSTPEAAVRIRAPLKCQGDVSRLTASLSRQHNSLFEIEVGPMSFRVTQFFTLRNVAPWSPPRHTAETAVLRFGILRIVKNCIALPRHPA
ncbi:MAG: hypothetical protein ABGZ35_33010, partial [Planctomycetaceae bacterium]